MEVVRVAHYHLTFRKFLRLKVIFVLSQRSIALLTGFQVSDLNPLSAFPGYNDRAHAILLEYV